MSRFHRCLIWQIVTNVLALGAVFAGAKWTSFALAVVSCGVAAATAVAWGERRRALARQQQAGR